jgi:hypothetical protein
MKVRHIKRRTVRTLLASRRITVHVPTDSPAWPVLVRMTQQQRESFINAAVRWYVRAA